MSKKFAVLVLAILVSPFVHLAEAQQAGKVYRIGYLSHGRKSTRAKHRHRGPKCA